MNRVTISMMASPKREKQDEVSQNKDFVWTIQNNSEDMIANSFSSEEKTKIASKTFPGELKFDVSVDLAGSKYAFNALKEGLETKGNISKSFAEMKQFDPSNLADPLNLEDSFVTKLTS